MGAGGASGGGSARDHRLVRRGTGGRAAGIAAGPDPPRGRQRRRNHLMNDQQQSLARQIEALGPWFHNLTIKGIPTAPEHFLGDYPAFKWAAFKQVVPADLTGMSVLDIGCNAGFYAMEMK